MARIPTSIVKRGVKAAKPPISTELAPVPAAQITAPAPVIEPVAPGDIPAPKVASLAPGQTDIEAMRTDVVRAASLSESNLGDYDKSVSYQPNFDVMKTSDDVKAVIADVSDMYKSQIDVARRGVITNQQLKGLASDLDVQEDVVKAVLERESGGVLNPETILASRKVLNASADRLLTLARKVREGSATDLDRITFRRQFEFHADFQRQWMGARAEAGRALNAFGIPVGATKADIKRLKDIVERVNGHDTDELAQVLDGVDSVQGINKLTREYTRSRVEGVLQELFVNSILSGIKTHVVNTTGNILFQAMNVAETALAARMGRFLPGDEHVEIGEASAQIYGMINGWRDGLKLAKRAFKTGTPTDAAQKYEANSWRAISSRNLLPENAPIGLARAVDGIGTFIRLPTERVMLPVDEFFKAVAGRSELSRLAYLDAMKAASANPMTPDQIAEHIRKYMEAPSKETLGSMRDYSRYVTFQTPLGPGGTMLAAGLSRIPGGRIIAPFINTPANLLKAGLLERSPLAVFSSEFRAAMKEGGPRRDLALARVSMGTLTVGMAVMASLSGLITGGGPQDPAARKILEATGWQPYSIAITNPETGEVSYQSYARAEPFAYVIGATADAVEVGAFLDYDDELKSEGEQFTIGAAAIIAGVSNNTMSKTFMQGIMDFSEMLSDPARYAKGWVGNMAGAFIPYSSLRREISRIQDPYIREAWTVGEKIKKDAGIPGYSSGAPPRRDFFGDPVRYRGGSFLGIMSPFPDSKKKNDPVTNELERVMRSTREVPIGMPGKRMPSNIPGITSTMPLELSEYDELIQIARSEPIFDGMTFKQKLQDTINSDAYQSAEDQYKIVLLKQDQQIADRVGRALLLERNPELAERFTNWQMRATARMYGAQAVE